MKKLTFSYPWFVLFAAPLPFFYFLFQFFFGMQSLGHLESEIARVQHKAERMEGIQARETLIMDSLKHTDPAYIDKHLESIPFLQPEIKKLEAVTADHSDDDALIKRLEFLKAGKNKLVFTEEKIRNHPQFREVDEKQQHPVQMSEEDLKMLLSLIEGITIWPYGPQEGRPHLLITDFHLIKKEIPSQDAVFLVSTQLIKREAPEPLLKDSH